jgi:hypothetical protein
MIRFAFALFFAVSLAGCGKEEVADDSGALEQALARDDLETNDLTAIDAASAHDANMARDIDPAEFANADGAVVEQIGGQPARPRQRAATPGSRPEPATESPAPASNSASEQPAETDSD